jgi:membrane-associated phospholipid phosphatase
LNLSYVFEQKIVYDKMLAMRQKRSPVFLILIVLLCSTFIWPQSIFEKSSKTDIPIMSGALGGLGLSLYLGKNLKPLTLEEVGQLRQLNVPSFDRWACQNFSPKADKLSDVLLNISVLSPVLMLASPALDVDQKWTYALMYLETGILTYSITEFTKIMAKRIRPFAYNPEVPVYDKIRSSNARKSFFSGHTSMSFASAAFFAQTYAAFHPDSRWKPAIWGIGLSTATLVGILRILSGKHFPTDVLVGALVGSLIGIVIPKLHEVESITKNNSNRAFQVTFRFSF